MLHNLRQRIIAYFPGKTLKVTFDEGAHHKPTLVFLHGIAATSETWNPLIFKLDYTKYRVIAMDLLGFGESPTPEDCTYSPDEHALYVYRTLSRLNVKTPFTLVGHSMGSIISVHYSHLWPKQVKRLILVSLPLYIRDKTLATARIRRQTDFYLAAYKFFRTHARFTISGAQSIRKLLRLSDGIDVNSKNWDAFRLSLRNTIEKQHTYEEMESLTVPIDLIVGRQDEFAVSGALKLAAMSPHITLQRIPIGDHAVSDRTADAIVSALNQPV